MFQLGWTFTGKRCVTAYSNNLGNIKSYELDFGYTEGMYLHVHTDSSVFCLYDKTGQRTRVHSCMYLSISGSEFSPEDQKQIEEAKNRKLHKWDVNKQDNVPFTAKSIMVIDPRVIRAYILGTWKIETLRQKGYSNDELLNEANAFINEDVEWTVDDAKDWMEVNGYTPLEIYEHLDASEEREALRPWDRLPHPDWKPSHKNKV